MDVFLGSDADERIGQRAPFRHKDLGAHQVDTCHHLGNGVLHLDAGVHLDKVMVSVLVHQEFQGSCVGVAHVLCDLDRIRMDGFAHVFGYGEGRRKFHDLLVAALQGAVALVQMHHVAAFVA